MSNKKIEKTAKGFVVKPSEELLRRQARDKRMEERKSQSKSQITNKEIFEFLLDISERQEEILQLVRRL